MSLSKSKCWYSNNCLHFLKRTNILIAVCSIATCKLNLRNLRENADSLTESDTVTNALIFAPHLLVKYGHCLKVQVTRQITETVT